MKIEPNQIKKTNKQTNIRIYRQGRELIERQMKGHNSFKTSDILSKECAAHPAEQQWLPAVVFFSQ